MDCDGTYECAAEGHARGCLSADLDPPAEHALSGVDELLAAGDAWDAAMVEAAGRRRGVRPAGACWLDYGRDCGHPRCLDCPASEPW